MKINHDSPLVATSVAAPGFFFHPAICNAGQTYYWRGISFGTHEAAVKFASLKARKALRAASKIAEEWDVTALDV